MASRQEDPEARCSEMAGGFKPLRQFGGRVNPKGRGVHLSTVVTGGRLFFRRTILALRAISALPWLNA